VREKKGKVKREKKRGRRCRSFCPNDIKKWAKFWPKHGKKKRKRKKEKTYSICKNPESPGVFSIHTSFGR
jgi:hypothetical protein